MMINNMGTGAREEYYSSIIDLMQEGRNNKIK